MNYTIKKDEKKINESMEHNLYVMYKPIMNVFCIYKVLIRIIYSKKRLLKLSLFCMMMIMTRNTDYIG